MPQIDEFAPDLSVAEWVQGEPSNISAQKGRIVVIKVFQVNCPGCFSVGFPEIIKSYKKYNISLSHKDMNLINYIYENSTVLLRTDKYDKVKFKILCNESDYNKIISKINSI